MSQPNQNPGNAGHKQGSGNFAQDKERASEAGRKGGEHSHGGSSQGSTQGGGNFAQDRERASETGKKGGAR